MTMARNQTPRAGMRRAVSAALLVLCLAGAAVLWIRQSPGGQPELQGRGGDGVARLPYDQVGRYLAGMQLPPSSPLQPLTHSAQYRAHGKQSRKSWRRYRRRVLRPMAVWSEARLSHSPTELLFYPFGGPDLLNAMTLFPGATDYILVGLEPPGRVPDPRGAGHAERIRELWKLRGSLRSLLTVNFFRTFEMQADLRAGSHASITGILLLMLARQGCRVLAVDSVYLDGSGQVVKAATAAGRRGGVQILFRRPHSERTRRLRFLRVNLSNTAQRRQQSFARFLGRRDRFVTLLKSASYLLHQPRFSMLREQILSRSTLVLQSDCGIPLRDLDRGGWRVTPYGSYRVLRKFSRRFQPDLQLLFKHHSRGPLTFPFGYGFTPERSSLMLARRFTRPPRPPAATPRPRPVEGVRSPAPAEPGHKSVGRAGD